MCYGDNVPRNYPYPNSAPNLAMDEHSMIDSYVTEKECADAAEVAGQYAVAKDKDAAAGPEAPSQVPDAVARAQAIVKCFVRNMVRGSPVSLLCVGGGTAECCAFLDRGLTTLSLARSTKDTSRREVALEDVDEILVGRDGGAEFGLDTDESCVTLVLENNQAISLTFAEEEERDTFALCFSMFVDGRRGEVRGRRRDEQNPQPPPRAGGRSGSAPSPGNSS